MIESIKKYCKKKQINKGYSLVEVLITLIVVNIILLMLSNIIVSALQVSIKVKERSRLREELSTIVNLVQKDFRNASKINDEELTVSEECSGTTPCNKCIDSTICNVTVATNRVEWKLCMNDRTGELNSVCREKTDSSNTTTLEFKSDPSLVIEAFSFRSMGKVSINRDQVSVLFTIRGKHVVDDLEISNMFRQAVLSTSNYRI